jgi:hypothetical protein
MRKYLLPGLMTAISISLSASLLVGAQTTQPSSSETTTTTTTSSYQSTSVQPLATPAMIENQSLSSSGEVVVGPEASSTVMPRLTVGMGTTSIDVVNTTPKPVMFSSPVLNLSYEIPANAQRTIQIDRAQTASLTPGQEVAYYINDSQGNVIASSSFVNHQEVASLINTNTEFAYEGKSEPTAYTRSSGSTSRRSTVRGYW